MFELSQSYNVELAKAHGVSAAILYSHIQMLVAVKIKMSPNDENFTVSLNRDEIFNSTGLRDYEQRVAEECLSTNSLLSFKITQRNGIEHIRYALPSTVESKPKETVAFNPLDSITPVVESKPMTTAQLQRESIRKALKAGIPIADMQLRELMGQWVDTIFENPNGFLSKQGVSMAVDDLLKFSNDTKVLGDIIRIAIKFGYRDMTWAINRYKGVPSKPSADANWASYSTTKADKIYTENGEF